ncbi:hypothetical protein [Campylobacter sp. RM16188]|uniref:hypothetical protein n=1 Tax=Campylobacter sp. RM16188 TaxID=1705725 RepID=UPI0015526F14|nr:hypothetical protein [Campylobacter sp. RM16188]
MIKNTILGCFAVVFLTGCGAKVYHENQVFGKGVNSGYVFDTIDKDRAIVYKIQKNNADFFNYKLNWGVEKMHSLLAEKKSFDVKHTNENLTNPTIIQENAGKKDIFGDIARDFKYGNK